MAYTKAYESKFTFYMRTIESFEEYVDVIYNVLSENFLPTLFGKEELLSEKLLEVITLPPTHGGLGIKSLKDVQAPKQLAASISNLSTTCRDQRVRTPNPSEEIKKQKQSLK